MSRGKIKKMNFLKRKNHSRRVVFKRAGKGTRTLDPDLGKVVLYQLSYSREDTPIIHIKKERVKRKSQENEFFD